MINYIYMSKLISGLKKKPTPKQQHAVGIKLPEAAIQQPLEIKIKTKDKRSDHVINHNALLSSIKAKKGTKHMRAPKTVNPVPEPSDKLSTVRENNTVDEPDEKLDAEPDADPCPDPHARSPSPLPLLLLLGQRPEAPKTARGSTRPRGRPGDAL